MARTAEGTVLSVTPLRLAAVAALALVGTLAIGLSDGGGHAAIGKAHSRRVPTSDARFSVTVASRSHATVTLRWPAVRGVRGYAFFRDGELLSRTSDPGRSRATFSLPPAGRHLFEVQVLGKPLSAQVFVGRNGGGCFSSLGACGYPDPAYGNVGVPAGTTLTPMAGGNITTDGTVINDRDITDCVNVYANNVTIENSRITCATTSAGPWVIYLAGNNFTLRNVILVNTGIAGVNGVWSIGVTGTVIDHVTSTGIEDFFHDSHGSATIENSYMAVQDPAEGDHVEPVYCDDSTLNIQHSVLLNAVPQTADLLCNTNNGSGGPCSNNLTINSSLLAGGGYSVYPCAVASSAGSSVVTITNNRFARCTRHPIVHSVYNSNGETCTGGFPGYSGAGAPPCAVPYPGTGTCSQLPGQVPDQNGYYPRSGYFGYDSYIFCSSTTWSGNVWDNNGTAARC